MSQRPLSTCPKRAAKHAAESKHGQHSQSIEPSRLINAADLQSPINEWSPIGCAILFSGVCVRVHRHTARTIFLVCQF